MISIIDYGVGNLGSIQNMIARAGLDSKVISTAGEIESSEKILLPGVGSFDHGMLSLDRMNLVGAIKVAVLDRKVPTLGICLGMQILMDSSEEGSLPGLSLISGVVKKFTFDGALANLKVPHMGWNSVRVCRDNPLFFSDDSSRFYFVHSYYVEPSNCDEVLTTSSYGIDFCSSMQKDNLLAVQFHPEKSHRFGLDLFKRFGQVI